MSLSDLPVELLDQIFEPLSPNALAALAITTSFFNSSATRHLYRDISLSAYTHNLNAVNTLATQPRLASLVRNFSLNVDDSDGVLREYYVLLSNALQNMPNLHSLDLHVDSHASWILFPSSSGGSPLTYSGLQHFATSFSLDKNLMQFLTRTPSLISLQLPPSFIESDCAELPLLAIPNLASYTGPSSFLRQIAPGRPLVTLHLSGDLSLHDIEHISHSVLPVTSNTDAESGVDSENGVEVLSAITSTPPTVFLETLAKACPRLACLRVMTTCAFWEAPDLTFYSSIANTLSTLRSLNAFELSGMHWESRPKSTAVSDDGAPSEKEWVSPPVTPRVLDVDEVNEENSHDFEEAFLEWAY
ncbi:hypothetical protein C8Q75DRAFT_808327 [Abortiporus biennis]|nr:hypothetical protein C8Q75DRAFT_808327 [Abortiporus biennis]